MAVPKLSPGAQRERLTTKRKIAVATVRAAEKVKARMEQLIASFDELIANTNDPGMRYHLEHLRAQAAEIRESAAAVIAEANKQRGIVDLEIRESDAPIPFRRRGDHESPRNVVDIGERRE